MVETFQMHSNQVTANLHPTDAYISMITRRSSCRVLNQCCIGVIVPLISTSMCVIIPQYTVDEAPILECPQQESFSV